jgi:hypothetical protein
MATFLLLFATAIWTAWQLSQSILMGVWGKPFNPLEGIAFLGSLVLFASSYIALFNLRRAIWSAVGALVLLWACYLPAIIATVPRVSRASPGEMFMAFGPVVLLGCSTVYSGIKVSGFLKREVEHAPQLVECPKIFRYVVLSLTGLAAAAVVIYRPFSPQKRVPCVYELPEGFTGWVLITFERSGEPTIPVKDGKLIFQIGPDGRLVTSSSVEFGWASDEYVYVGTTRTKLAVTGWGGGGRVWGEANGQVQRAGLKPLVYEIFFIGLESEFNASKAPDPAREIRSLTIYRNRRLPQACLLLTRSLAFVSAVH